MQVLFPYILKLFLKITLFLREKVITSFFLTKSEKSDNIYS